MIVSYSTGSYDGWEILISLFGLWFGFSYLRDKMGFDWFSNFIGAFIMISSAMSLSVAFIQYMEWMTVAEIKQFTDSELVLFSTELKYVLCASIGIFIFIQFNVFQILSRQKMAKV